MQIIREIKTTTQRGPGPFLGPGPIWFFFFFSVHFVFSPPILAVSLSPDDRQLLERIERDSIRYFVHLSDKITGLTHDSSRSGSPASIAATGFGLAAIAIGASRGWIDEGQAYSQLEKTLRILLTKAPHQNGFFYHFLDPRSARRVWGSEASSIDTALLAAGALLAGEFYPGTRVQFMARKLYERTHWPWMLNGSSLFSMGWKPESGFLTYRWDSYNELIILQALAIGSGQLKMPLEVWRAWQRREDEYEGEKIIYSHSGSLFTYQYAQAYIDFRNLSDQGINYFENSRLATLANRDYSFSFRSKFQSYSENSWGLSASLGPGGYRAYGGKPGEGFHDGTIASYAPISSLVFTPGESLAAVRFLLENYESELYGDYGFKDAFNLDKNWWAEEYLGIDQGISVLMLENFLNHGAIWEKFMRLEPIRHWIETCGLKEKVSADANPSSKSVSPSGPPFPR